MPRVSLQYYALLREQAGRQAETLDTSAATPAALYAELAARHGFRLPASHVLLNERLQTKWFVLEHCRPPPWPSIAIGP